MQCATDFVRCQNSSGRLSSRSRCAPRAVGWTRPGEWTPGWTAGAMSEYGCEALPGMMKLPHSANLHPRRLCARSAGAPSTCDSLTPAVRQWRQRGLAAAVLVPSVGRPGGWCSCGLLSQAHAVDSYLCSSLKTLNTPLGGPVCGVPLIRFRGHPCILI